MVAPSDEMVFDNRDNPFHYILSAIKLTETYARELGKPLAVYNMSIDSDLDSTDGKKFGLGSSAAVTVATVKALNAFYALGMTPDQVYKLAAIAHLDIQGNGSLGDIAASVYGGWIAYRSFDKAWLAAQRRDHSLRELLAMSWPGLSIELLQAPAAMQLVIGWTGSPASTSQLVDKIAIAQARERAEYKQFLAASKATIEHIIDGFHAGAWPRFKPACGATANCWRTWPRFPGSKSKLPSYTPCASSPKPPVAPRSPLVPGAGIVASS